MPHRRFRSPESDLVPAAWRRPPEGSVFPAPDPNLPLTGLPAWRSNGGSGRGHPARALPFSLEAAFPHDGQAVVGVHLAGVFAMNADRESESAGTIGASIHVLTERETAQRYDLVHGQHYNDARATAEAPARICGDGVRILSIGETSIDGVPYRVDLLSFEINAYNPRLLRFKDLGSPASFVLFDILFEVQRAGGCPFRGQAGAVSLSELGQILRLGDRLQFQRALAQLEDGIYRAQDLDEARGQALTFLAVVTAATLEAGGKRELHREQLEAAREFDRIHDAQDLFDAAARRIDHVSAELFPEPEAPTMQLVDRALQYIERNFALDISDADVAKHLKLSNSHFRHVFRQGTGQPFHRYLVSLRLEKARRLLAEQDLPVSKVAQAVGFTNLSHFSRAFTHRFGVNPGQLRKGAAT